MGNYCAMAFKRSLKRARYCVFASAERKDSEIADSTCAARA